MDKYLERNKMNQQPDLDKMSVTELKSLAYDCMAIVEQQRTNLQVINQKIAEKSQNGQPDPKPMQPKEDK